MLCEVISGERSGAGKLVGVIRAKEYLKPGYPLDAYTPIPDVASRCLGCTWDQANKVAMVDTVGCNMDCVGCYQSGRSKESVEVSAGDIAALFSEDAADFPVWRISGGEPTMQDDFPQVVWEVSEAAGREHIVWVNTNALRGFAWLADVAVLPNVFIEVSLKGFTDDMARANTRIPEDRILGRQLDTVHQLVTEGANLLLNVYTAAPEGWATTFEPQDIASDAMELMEKLGDIDPTLPFRVTPVHVMGYNWWPEPDVEWVTLVDTWNEAKAALYEEWFVDLNTPPSAFLGLGSTDRPNVW